MIKQVARTTVAAAAAFALSAGAADAAVPNGVIEHRVYDVFTAAPAPGLPQHTRVEHFVAEKKDRAVIADAGTGAVVTEIVKDGTTLRTWEKSTNVVRSSSDGIAGKNFTLGRADEALNTGSLLSSGVLTLTGETTWNGRPAVTARFDGAENRGQIDATYTLDPTSKQVLEIQSLPGQPGFSRKLVADEDLPTSPANLAKLEMGTHAGAKLVGSAAKAKKAKKQAAKRRAAAAKRRG